MAGFGGTYRTPLHTSSSVPRPLCSTPTKAPRLPSAASHKTLSIDCRSCPRLHAAAPASFLLGSRANSHASHCAAFHQPTIAASVQTTCISCPASLTISHSSLNVSSECPGMNHVVLILYLSKSFSRRRTPTVPAKSPAMPASIGRS